MHKDLLLAIIIGCIAVGVIVLLVTFYDVCKSYRKAKSRREHRNIGFYFLCTVVMVGAFFALQVFSTSKFWRRVSLSIFLVLLGWILRGIWRHNKIQAALIRGKWGRRGKDRSAGTQQR